MRVGLAGSGGLTSKTDVREYAIYLTFELVSSKESGGHVIRVEQGTHTAKGIYSAYLKTMSIHTSILEPFR